MLSDVFMYYDHMYYSAIYQKRKRKVSQYIVEELYWMLYKIPFNIF